MFTNPLFLPYTIMLVIKIFNLDLMRCYQFFFKINIIISIQRKKQKQSTCDTLTAHMVNEFKCTPLEQTRQYVRSIWWFDDGLIWSMVWILLFGFYSLSLKGDRLSCCRHFLSIVYYWILFSVFASYLFELVLDFQKRKVVVSFFSLVFSCSIC